MFEELEKITNRPKPFEFYTASDLWTDEHTSKQMLKFHLKEDIDVSSRNAEFIDRSVEWIASAFKIGAGTKIADFGCGRNRNQFVCHMHNTVRLYRGRGLCPNPQYEETHTCA